MKDLKKKLLKLFSAYIPRNNDTKLNVEFARIVMIQFMLEEINEIYAETPQEVLEEVNAKYGSFKVYIDTLLRKFLGI